MHMRMRMPLHDALTVHSGRQVELEVESLPTLAGWKQGRFAECLWTSVCVDSIKHKQKGGIHEHPSGLSALPDMPGQQNQVLGMTPRSHEQHHHQSVQAHCEASCREAHTLAVFRTAPRPVDTPQPSKQALSRGALLSIFATLTSCTTVYSENVDVPICTARLISECSRSSGPVCHS